MQICDGQHLFSASDLVGFLNCEHLSALELINLETPLPKVEADEHTQLIQAKGDQHEKAYLARLKDAGLDVVEINAKGIEAQVAATREAMATGAAIIFQACLRQGEFIGYADFLRRVDSSSRFGDYSYEVIDTKLARRPKAKFLIQLCLYSDLLEALQGVRPQQVHLVLGDNSEQSFPLDNYFRYYRKLKSRFLDWFAASAAARNLNPRSASPSASPPASPPNASGYRPSYPEPCGFCPLCHWRERCGQQWQVDDHLSLVANINRSQRDKLVKAGVTTLAALAAMPPQTTVAGMQPESLLRLQAQAQLQLGKRQSGNDAWQLLDPEQEPPRGFGRLPKPDDGDLFFDMEGDPLMDDGLEYLFGVWFRDADQHDNGYRFRAFWAHDRKQERTAFEAFMAFVTERLKRYPDAHIYHYASYEESALKRLMSLHGVCEVEVDHLLREELLVDLYKVVREGLLVSEPRYSIKNLETFYMERREGEVTEAGASIVYYERWRESGDDGLLEQIHAYNEDDCRSTQLLRDWLLSLRPTKLPWFIDSAVAEPDKPDWIRELELRLADYRERLLAGFPDDPAERDDEARQRELVHQLLDFHRRAAKPQWWALYHRSEMSDEELIADAECIGGLEVITDCRPEPVKTSHIYSYRYPEQDFKRKPGERCLRVDNQQVSIVIEALDEDNRVARLKYPTRKHGEPPPRFSITSGFPFNTRKLSDALFRFADSVIVGDHYYPALEGLLGGDKPRLDGRSSGQPIIAGNGTDITELVEATLCLRDSHLFIQGPPGAGKTYAGSRLIVALIAQGCRIGVSSNSHKAINNLLAAVERHAIEQGIEFTGVKKCSGPESYCNGSLIADITDTDGVVDSGADLLAGTAWLFANPALDQSLDYLFVDEAGQVALGNLVAMGTCARNIVLLGDQMQLQQPIQGVHPGHSGKSALDFLLRDRATVPPDEGIFLATTWRMHPDLCRFISDAVYDGRLLPEPDNQRQRLVLSENAPPDLCATGLRFIAVHHDGCSQRSQQEAKRVRELYDDLLRHAYTDRDGIQHPMTAADILVVAPYNMQVNLLQRTLGDAARVGTVDKFQGQEAQVVIVSMATSSGDYLPRNLEFLYSRNRINVALSRARCLALLVASPALLTVPCRTVDQMALVNTLCWAADYGART